MSATEVVTVVFGCYMAWCHVELLPSRRTFCVHHTTNTYAVRLSCFGIGDVLKDASMRIKDMGIQTESKLQLITVILKLRRRVQKKERETRGISF